MVLNPEPRGMREFHHPVTGERLTIRRRSRDTNGESFVMDLAIGPLSFLLAPVGRALGYRSRYERYSGPEDA